jgi:hypothetical protein
VHKVTGISKKEVLDYNKKMCLTLRAGKES